MIITLLLFALWQDGPIQTAPERPPTESAAPEADDDANPSDALNSSGPGQTTPRQGRYNRLREAVAAARQERQDTIEWNVGTATSEAGGEVPAWAFTDPARWELSQCGGSGDDACRRQARNRLAMARAGVAAEPAASGGASGDEQNCRMVMRRSESGFGGSLSRVCGDEAAVQDLLGRLDVPAQPRPEPCDRPGSLETQAAWIARCQALPAR